MEQEIVRACPSQNQYDRYGITVQWQELDGERDSKTMTLNEGARLYRDLRKQARFTEAQLVGNAIEEARRIRD